MGKKVISILVGLLCVGAVSLFAGDSAEKKNAFKQIASIEGRGLLNLVTVPGEIVATAQNEKESHPKFWPATYIPRLFTNIATRVGSSVHDVAVLPWYVRASGDDTPMTRRFDMPDYVWQKE